MTRKLIKTNLLLLTFLLILHLPLTTMHAYAESKALDDVVVLETKGEYDETAVQEMRERIERIHPAFLNVLARENIVIKLINFPLTDLDEYAYLKGDIPRGWEETGYTWDDVPGAGGDPTVAKIGYSEPLPVNFHDSLNLELHEIAHAVDQFVFDEISYGEEFGAIHAAEQSTFLPDVYFDFVEEYFAEVFAYYYLDEATKENLKVNAPRTYMFIDNLPKKIPDTEAPVITLNGEETLLLNAGDIYHEEGAVAIDDIYGDLSDEISVEGEVDPNESGEYTVSYSVKNEAGDVASTTRTVTIKKAKMKDYIVYKKDILSFFSSTGGKLKKA